MKHLKVYESQNIEYFESFDSIFYFLKFAHSHVNGQQAIEFLKTLNLTYEQYSKLAEIMEDYGQEQYDEGYSSFEED